MKILPSAALLLLLTTLAHAADNGSVKPNQTPSVTDLTRAYLDGKWDTVESLLRDHAREFASLPAEKAPERADVNSIRQAFAECRQSWWPATKPGNKIAIHPSIWGRPLEATYDPSATPGVQFSNTNGSIHFTVAWPPDDMDSNAKAEHGFTKGELAELAAWMTIGNADAWATVPQSALSNSPDSRTALSRYLDFRSSLAGAYYGSPRVRRWAFFLCLNTYEPKYAKMETASSRKAIGAFLVAEILSNPAKYPSIKFPTLTDSTDAEEKSAQQIKSWIEKHGWTLDEDKHFRESLRLFAALNPRDVLRSQTITLQNKLLVSLDPEKDKPLAPKRDAWLFKQLPKAPPK